LGHERIGFLPQTRQWQAITGQLASFDSGSVSVAQIANKTLDAVKRTYEAMPFDESIIRAMSFLATLSYSANQTNQTDFLNNNGYVVDSQISLFSLMESAQEYITTEAGSLEINKIAKDATIQAIIEYQDRHKTEQLSLFTEQSDSVWSKAGTGAAFCELSCAFFASLTERQLKYYIERVAASSIDNYETLHSFNKQLSAQSKAIAEHTFEISKLVRSFSAGWFNKNSVHSLPTEQQIIGFLSMSFGKLREELRREADGN